MVATLKKGLSQKLKKWLGILAKNSQKPNFSPIGLEDPDI